MVVIMALMSPQSAPQPVILTYDDYRRLPDDGKHDLDKVFK